MTFTGQFLYHMVVAVFVGYEERAFNFTLVRIVPFVVENFSVVVVVVQVDGSVESEEYHLWSLQVINVFKGY